MELKRVDENGNHYYVIEDEKEPSENVENSEKRNTVWHIIANKVAKSPTAEAVIGAVREGYKHASLAVASIYDGTLDVVGGAVLRIGEARAKGKLKHTEDTELSKLKALLPYADREGAHIIAEQMRKYPEALLRADQYSILSLLDGDERDSMFLFLLERDPDRVNLSALLPLVSASAVSHAVSLISDTKIPD